MTGSKRVTEINSASSGSIQLALDLRRTTAQVKPFQTSAVQRHRSILSDLCLEKAELCPKKAEAVRVLGRVRKDFL